jgi:uncharacterized protein (DUF1778 family)
MHVVEIEDSLAAKINQAAKAENKSFTEFVNSSLREVLKRAERRETDEEKVKRFAESYKKFPQKSEEFEIWQDEQIWEDE